MKNIKIDTNEVQRILFLHENYKNTLLREQSKEKTREEVLKWFADAKRAGCLKDPNLNYNSVFKTKSDDGTFKYFIKGPSNSMKDKIKRVYDDYTVEIVDPTTGNSLRSLKWECSPQDSPTQSVPKSLNANQLFILNELEKLGWSNTPVPTDVEVDNKMFLKMDLTGTDVDTNVGLSEADKLLVDRYKKWFADYPNGFFVYKRNLGFQSPDKIEREDKVEVTIESCKTAIERLHNNLLNPRTHPLTTKQKTNFRETAITCNEPANKGKFFAKFALNRKVKKLEQQRVI
jgi:hypothetical protein